MDLGLMQRFDSGQPYDYSISVDSGPYVTNPGYLAPPATIAYFISGRGTDRFNGASRTDLSLSWNRAAVGKTKVFARFVLTNVFNRQSLTNFNTTLLSRIGDTTLAAFNPFTAVPAEGVKWKRGPSFGF